MTTNPVTVELQKLPFPSISHFGTKSRSGTWHCWVGLLIITEILAQGAKFIWMYHSHESYSLVLCGPWAPSYWNSSCNGFLLIWSFLVNGSQWHLNLTRKGTSPLDQLKCPFLWLSLLLIVNFIITETNWGACSCIYHKNAHSQVGPVPAPSIINSLLCPAAPSYTLLCQSLIKGNLKYFNIQYSVHLAVSVLTGTLFPFKSLLLVMH